MPINHIITRFSHVSHERGSVYAWLEPLDKSDYNSAYGANFQKMGDTLAFIVANVLDFAVGDYICAFLSEFPLSDDTLQEFLEKVPHYKISEIRESLLPGGDVHHLEIRAAKQN